jgi:hypothetical protein
MKTRVLLFIVAFSISTYSDLIASAFNDTIPKLNDTIPKVEKSKKRISLTPYHRNVIKINPTPMLIWGSVRNLSISYERLINNNMSLSLQLGYLRVPKLTDDTLLNLVAISERSRDGMNFAFDYRYYPGARNRRPAPDGLYIGAYLSYYGIRFKNHMDVLYTTVDQNGGLNGKIDVVNLGLELGYQFIFWKRFSLDLLMFGPSVTYMHGYLEISGNLDKDQIQNIDKEIVDKLLNRFPLLGTLFNSETLKFTGSKTNFGALFRYSIQLGFHF